MNISIFENKEIIISYQILKIICFELFYLWSRRWSCRRNALPQMSHENGRSSVWVRSWINRLYDLVNCRWQKRQMNFFRRRLVIDFFVSISFVWHKSWCGWVGCVRPIMIRVWGWWWLEWQTSTWWCSSSSFCSSGSVADLAKLAKSNLGFFTSVDVITFRSWSLIDGLGFTTLRSNAFWLLIEDAGGGVILLILLLLFEASGVCGGVSKPNDVLDASLIDGDIVDWFNCCRCCWWWWWWTRAWIDAIKYGSIDSIRWMNNIIE